ncbi:CoA transferase, partial [Mycobacterium sp. ITM-2017-0098]
VLRLDGVTGDEAVGPHIDSVAVGTAIDRHGMAAVELDPSTPARRAQFADLLAGVDILIENTRPGSRAEATLSVRDIHARYPQLV